jgi:hypothetical protein
VVGVVAHRELTQEQSIVDQTDEVTEQDRAEVTRRRSVSRVMKTGNARPKGRLMMLKRIFIILVGATLMLPGPMIARADIAPPLPQPVPPQPKPPQPNPPHPQPNPPQPQPNPPQPQPGPPQPNPPQPQ